MCIKLKKLHDDAKFPTQKKGDAAFDLYASSPTIIHPGKTGRVSLGLAIADWPPRVHPFDIFGKIEGRSGMAAVGIFPVGGIVDMSYRGEIQVILFNSTEDDYYVSVGDRVAQMVFYPCLTGRFGSVDGIAFEEAEDIINTDRGTTGFGSSGK